MNLDWTPLVNGRRWWLYALASVGVLIGLVAVGSLIPGMTADDAFASEVYGLSLYGVVIWFLVHRFGKARISLGNTFLSHRFSRIEPTRLALVIAVLVVLSSASFVAVYSPLSWFFPDFVLALVNESSIPVAAETKFVGLSMALQWLTACLVAPVVEEFFFRGFLLGRLTVRWNPRVALLVSSAVFGVLHADLLGAFAFGLVMGLLAQRTGSLHQSIVCHIANNTIAMALVYGDFAVNGGETFLSLSDLRSLYLPAVLVLTVAGWFLFVVFRRHWPPRVQPAVLHRFQEYP